MTIVTIVTIDAFSDSWASAYFTRAVQFKSGCYFTGNSLRVALGTGKVKIPRKKYRVKLNLRIFKRWLYYIFNSYCFPFVFMKWSPCSQQEVSCLRMFYLAISLKRLRWDFQVSDKQLKTNICSREKTWNTFSFLVHKKALIQCDALIWKISVNNKVFNSIMNLFPKGQSG